jgi:hypothetical protein
MVNTFFGDDNLQARADGEVRPTAKRQTMKKS